MPLAYSVLKQAKSNHVAIPENDWITNEDGSTEDVKKPINLSSIATTHDSSPARMLETSAAAPSLSGSAFSTGFTSRYSVTLTIQHEERRGRYQERHRR